MAMILGMDLGIKTGSLVQVEVDPKYNLIANCRVLVSWSKGPKIKSSLDQEILRFFNQHIFPWIQFEFAETLAVDWNIKEIYWSANKHNSAVKTFIAGYLMCDAHKKGIHVCFLPPKEVRSFFGMPQGLKKNEVQRHFLTMPTIHTGRTHSYRTDHDLDAVILAYVLNLKLRGEKCPEFFRYDKNQW